jgi:electron transport complex protein RnfG
VLLIGLSSDGLVTGVRVLAHDETPTLGGAIDANDGAWLEQFSGTNARVPAAELWTIKAEDGAFDALTGATVTSRGVIAAVRDALLYFEQHRDDLYEAARTASHDDAL